MEEIKIKGIVLNSKDYKEKDKLVEIFSLELGKIFACLKGCKTPTSKLKFAYQPFCFAEFLLSKQGDNYLITNATLLDSFFDITNNAVTYMNSSLILELTGECLVGEHVNSLMFLNVLDTLKVICYDKVSSKLALIKFCENLLSYFGYKLTFNKCSNCKMDFTNNIFFDLDSGELLCGNCKTINSMQVSKIELACLRIIDQTDFNRLSSIKFKENVLNSVINLLCENFEYRIGKKLKTKKMLVF